MRNADLVRTNSELQSAIEELTKIAKGGLDLIKQNYAEKKISHDQQVLDAVFAYWCPFCPSSLVNHDVDITLAPSHSYFYLGALVLFLLLGAFAGGLTLVARYGWIIIGRPAAQDVAVARKVINDSKESMQLVKTQWDELDKGFAELAKYRSDSENAHAKSDSQLDQKRTELEQLGWRVMEERTRIDTDNARYKQEEEARIADLLRAKHEQVRLLEAHIGELQQRRDDVLQELKDALELDEEAASRREAFGELFRPQKYREQASRDPQHKPDPTG